MSFSLSAKTLFCLLLSSCFFLHSCQRYRRTFSFSSFLPLMKMYRAFHVLDRVYVVCTHGSLSSAHLDVHLPVRIPLLLDLHIYVIHGNSVAVYTLTSISSTCVDMYVCILQVYVHLRCTCTSGVCTPQIRVHLRCTYTSKCMRT